MHLSSSLLYKNIVRKIMLAVSFNKSALQRIAYNARLKVMWHHLLQPLLLLLSIMNAYSLHVFVHDYIYLDFYGRWCTVTLGLLRMHKHYVISQSTLWSSDHGNDTTVTLVTAATSLSLSQFLHRRRVIHTLLYRFCCELKLHC